MKQTDYINELIDQGRFTEAKLLLSAGTVKTESVFELSFNLANGFYSCEQYRSARECFSSARKHGKIGLLATVKYANCLLQTGDRNDAIRILEDVSDNINALPQEALDIFLRIVVHVREYNLLAKAERKARLRFPNTSFYWFAGGALAYKRGSYFQAITFFGRAVELSPLKAPYRLALARSFLKLNRESEAIRALEGMELSDVACIADIMLMKIIFSEIGYVEGIENCCSELTRRYFQKNQT
ncbi:MAG: hypothetical protein CMJ76_13785 [Planctomycetaceae bacterium]|nr:hypothetical protein [Planctomycetaceae bacterium]|tara:strand:- start:565 stop:1290 length:726 start_codon:yes stop_codon:yes gene_type:complete